MLKIWYSDRYKRMKVLITGSTGLLGSTLLFTASPSFVLGATYHQNTLVPNVNSLYFKVDITEEESLRTVFSQFEPDVVIHTAAIATPDYCDKHQDEAYAVNVIGTKNILKYCKKFKSKLVFITTNGVYDGKNPPYNESAEAKPLDFYGKTKYEGEQLVDKSGVPAIIIRLITMYGWNNPNQRQNPLTWQIMMLGKNKNPINMVTDMFNNFLSVQEAAKAIWQAVEHGQYGESFNIAGKNCISRYQFAVEIAKIFGMDAGMITPVTLDYFNNYVERPKNTCFVTKKMEQVLELPAITTKAGLKYLKEHPISDTHWKQLS